LKGYDVNAFYINYFTF